MMQLSSDLELAHRELATWARLHQTEDDTDIGVWQALTVIQKAVSALRRYEGEAR